MIGGDYLATLAVGDIVETKYNSGTYIGEIIQDKGNFALVKILAVVTHPMQGDLHQRGQVEGVAFHERKALAYQEKMNARKRMTKQFEGEVPDYATSLKKAVNHYKTALQSEDTAFNQKSLEKISDLEKHFYHKIYNA